MQCKNECGKLVVQQPGRKPKVFCSDACRKAFGRKTDKPKTKADTFKDLPADVQASIEHHCSENNKGERPASHSRAAMTERALRYQATFGKGVLGVYRAIHNDPAYQGAVDVCQTCGGPVQHPAIIKCLKCSTGTPAPSKTPAQVAKIYGNGPPIPESGPLSVYSPERWARLQELGYEWVAHRGIAARAAGPNMTEVAAPVPGDPAYTTATEARQGTA